MAGGEVRRRELNWLVVLVALAGLTSCNAVKLSYEKADWLLAQWVGRYVDLSGPQDRALRAGLSDLHAWHRGEELPEYARLFDDAANRMHSGMTRAEIEAAVATVRARARILGARAGGTFAPVMASLSDAQVQGMEQRFAADNRKFEKRQLSGDPDDRLKQRSAWLQSQLEDWFGTLDRAQRARVEQLVAAFPDLPALRLTERKRRQAAVLQVAREGRSGGATQARLSALVSDLERGRPAPVQAAMKAWEYAFIDMLVELEGSLSPAQRMHAVNKLRAYAADFRELAGRQAVALTARAP